jgi:hypothetical protein
MATSNEVLNATYNDGQDHWSSQCMLPMIWNGPIESPEACCTLKVPTCVAKFEWAHKRPEDMTPPVISNGTTYSSRNLPAISGNLSPDI